MGRSAGAGDGVRPLGKHGRKLTACERAAAWRKAWQAVRRETMRTPLNVLRYDGERWTFVEELPSGRLRIRRVA